jgi:hypothetical protein
LAHGRNNPTGSIGFSPTMITLCAPFAFMSQAWVQAIAAFVVVLVLLFVLAWFQHARDLRRVAKEARERLW